MSSTLFQRPFDSITADDLRSLVDNEVAESRHLEYKRDLNRTSREHREEFLADVSAFANSHGGVIAFGIEANKDGLPVALHGLEVESEDELKLFLEGLLRSSLDPRLTGVDLRAIEIGGGKSCLLIRVQRSWLRPHMVSLGKYRRFYRRTSAGKECLTTSQLRDIFVRSNLAPERARELRRERLGMIESGETPVEIGAGGKLVLHLLPLEEPQEPVDLSRFDRELYDMRPVPLAGLRGHSYCLDGLVTTAGAGTGPASYALLIRSGSLEIVDQQTFDMGANLRHRIPSTIMVERIVRFIPSYLALQSRIGITSPVALCLSLLSVRDYRLIAERDTSPPFNRESALIPDVLVDPQDLDPATIHEALRTVFDTVWNAFGFPRCDRYDESGRWRGDSEPA